MSKGGSRFRTEAGEFFLGRFLVFLSVVVDSILLVLVTLVLIYAHVLIESFVHQNQFPVIDQLLLSSVQALTAAGTIGVLAAYLLKDVRSAFKRTWRL